MAVALALVSALAYGLADFLGGLVSRSVSTWSVAVVAQLSATLSTLTAALFVTGSPTPPDLLWAVLAGAGGGVGTGFLYRGLASGRMGVVAPVSAIGAALVPVAAGALGGERLPLPVWTGVVLALPGIWLVSSSPDAPAAGSIKKTGVRQRAGLAEGVLDGGLAGLGFGTLFAALGQVPDGAGLLPLALSQAVSLPTLVVLALVLRSPWLPRKRRSWRGLLVGPLAATGTLTFMLSAQYGYLTVAGVLASLYPAATVLLAALVLKERVHRAQGVGLGLCALAIGLVAGG